MRGKWLLCIRPWTRCLVYYTQCEHFPEHETLLLVHRLCLVLQLNHIHFNEDVSCNTTHNLYTRVALFMGEKKMKTIFLIPDTHFNRGSEKLFKSKGEISPLLMIDLPWTAGGQTNRGLLQGVFFFFSLLSSSEGNAVHLAGKISCFWPKSR